jgi:hypothetical protein
VVFGEHLEAYGNPALGGRPGGKLDIGPDASFPDPVVAAIPRMREAVAALGRDPSDIEIIGHLPLVRDGDGQPEPDASMANLGRLVEAGVTNVDVFLPAPTEYEAAVDYLALWAEAFHKALP